MTIGQILMFGLFCLGLFLGHYAGYHEGYVQGRKAVRKYYDSLQRVGR